MIPTSAMGSVKVRSSGMAPPCECDLDGLAEVVQLAALRKVRSEARDRRPLILQLPLILTRSSSHRLCLENVVRDHNGFRSWCSAPHHAPPLLRVGVGPAAWRNAFTTLLASISSLFCARTIEFTSS